MKLIKNYKMLIFLMNYINYQENCNALIYLHRLER